MKTSTPLRQRLSFLPYFARAVSGLATAAVIFLSLVMSARAVIDPTITQKVWKAKFGVTDAQLYLNGDPAQGLNTVWLNADDDGDGIKNMDELAAGTNPFSAGSAVKITSITADLINVMITFPTEDGKQYVVQGTSALGIAFTSVTPAVNWVGTGVPKTLTAAKGGNKFFRILVQDMDTDGDGASDWAEKIAGYNPNSAMTDGRTLDGAALSAAMSTFNQVTVTATKANATQPPDALTAPVEVGSVTVSRGNIKVGSLVAPNIVVPLQRSGTATEGVDYDSLASVSPVNFTAGVSKVVLSINPKASSKRTNVTAIVKALPGTGYNVASANSGSVVINPAGITDGTGLTAKYYNTSSANYSSGAAPLQTTIFAGVAQMTRTDAVVDFGTTFGISSVIVANIAVGNPCVVTTTRATSLTSGDSVTIGGVTGGTFSVAINGTFVVTVIDGTHFTVGSNCTVLPTGVTSATIVPASTANYNGWGTANGGPRGMSPASLNTAFSVRWTGQILPKYSESYFIDFRSDDSAKVWVNGVLLIDRWATQGPTDYSNSISLTAGVLYDIQIDYWNSTTSAEAKLYWWSASQPKEIIPQARLFPAPTQAGKFTAVTTSLTAVGYIGVPFSFSVVTPNISGTVTYAVDANSAPLPPAVPNPTIPNLLLNSATGQITGTPTVAGTYNVAVNALNSAAGGAVTGSSVLTITIYPAGSVTRETLVGTAITADGTIPTLDDDTDYGNNISRRLRGYIVPPKTGNYYFWLAANNAAELWISNDSESVNRVRRASVSASTGKKVWSPPTISGVAIGSPCSVTTLLPHSLANGDAVDITGVTGGTFSQPINGHFLITVTGVNTFTVPSNCTVVPTSVAGASIRGPRQSQWLYLIAGQKYYFDVLHNTGTDADDYVAVGWCQDDVGTVPAVTGDPNPNGLPPLIPDGGAALQGYPLSGVVPSYIFQPYDYPAVAPVTGSLYSANLGPQGSSTTKASGSANLQLNTAQTQAILHFSYQGLGSPRTAYHLHTDAFLTHPAGEIVFDIDDVDAFHPELKTADGGYIWNLTTGGTFTDIQQVRDAITGGRIYLNIHSVLVTAGEIRGNLTRVVGSQIPPDTTLYPEPSTTDSPSVVAQAARFLNQASFGASPSDVTYLSGHSFSQWIDDQLTKTPTHSSNDVVAGLTADINTPFPSSLFTDAWWKYSVTAQDQLRQRLAFALSEVLVVSWNNNTGPLQSNGRVLSDYYDTLVDYCLPTSGLADSGTFRGVLKNATLTPAMGLYLDMRGNQKEDLTIGRHPNENYAREIMQLFSVGLNRTWDDGKFVLNSNAGLVATYTQTSILGVAGLLTGWNYAQANQVNGRLPVSFGPAADYLNAMVLVPSQHDFVNPKLLLNNVVTPAATGQVPRVSISSIATGSPCTVTTTTDHGLTTGDTIRVAGVTGGTFSPVLTTNPTFQATVTGVRTFTIPVNYSNTTGINVASATVTGPKVTPATYITSITPITGSQVDSVGTALPHPYDQYGLKELDTVVDNICNNDNVPPYVCRQLIQRLVTSNPSPGYVYRVVQVWKNNGSGVRGDLAAVVRKILLDGEARSYTAAAANAAFGKQREPMLRLTGTARAFPAVPYVGTYAQLPANTVNANKLRITTNLVNNFSSGFTLALDFRGNYTTTSPPNPYTNPTSTTYGVSASLGIAATHTDISTIGTGNPTVITTTQPHGMPGPTNQVWPTGLSGIFNAATINGLVTATVTGPFQFTLPIATTTVFQVASVSVGNPCTVTTVAPHNLVAGTSTGVTINGVNGGAFVGTINGTNLTVINTGANTFTVSGVSCTSPPTSYTTWREVSNPCRVTTQVPHGLTTNDSVTISSVSGGSFTPTINGTFSVTVVDPTSFTVASSCAAASTINTGNIQGGNTLDVVATGMVNVTYSQAAGSNSMTVNTGGPQTDVVIPVPNSATTTLKSRVYLDMLTLNSTAGIASIATGNPCTVATSAPHGLSGGESVAISGVSGGTFSPSINSTYTVTFVDATHFTVLSSCTVVPTAATGTLTGSYGAIPADGIYDVQTTNASTSFTVLTADTPVAARSGSVIVPKISTSYTPISSNTVVQYNCNVNHNLQTGDHVWVDVPVVGTPLTDAEYVVSAPLTGTGILPVDEDHFQTSYLPVTSGLGVYPKPVNSNNGVTFFPLVAPPMGRSGIVTINQSTFTLGATDGSLSQSPLNAPTVFNYFFPNYKFPGTLSNSNLDSPEFQLTTDTNVSNLTNSLTNMFIGTGGGNGNLNGLSSFNNGGGSIVMDISGYLTSTKTSDGGISGLIDELAFLLVGAPLDAATKTTILNAVIGGRISAIGIGNPCTVTANVAHNFAVTVPATTFIVTISGVTGGTFSPTINGTYTATVTGPTTFTVPVNCTSITSPTALNVASAGFPIAFPMTSPTPTNLQMRDRVRAIIHLIITSAEYAVQK